MRNFFIIVSLILGLYVCLVCLLLTGQMGTAQAVEPTLGSSTTGPTLSTDSVYSAMTSDSKVIEKGKSIVRSNLCMICHMIDGKGGKKGDPFDGLSNKISADKIKLATTDPKKINPKSDMKAYNFSDDDMNAVIAYILSLPAKQNTK